MKIIAIKIKIQILDKNLSTVSLSNMLLYIVYNVQLSNKHDMQSKCVSFYSLIFSCNFSIKSISILF